MIKTNEALKALEAKIAVLEADILAAEKEDKSSGKLKRQARALKVIKQLINDYIDEDDFELGNNMEDELLQMINCKKGKRVLLEVHEGDKLGDLLEKYSTVQDIYRKLQDRCKELGLKIVLDHIERA